MQNTKDPAQKRGLFFRSGELSIFNVFKEDFETWRAKREHAKYYQPRPESKIKISPAQAFFTEVDDAISNYQGKCNGNTNADPENLNALKALHDIRERFGKESAKDGMVKKYKSELKDIIHPRKAHYPTHVRFTL